MEQKIARAYHENDCPPGAFENCAELNWHHFNASRAIRIAAPIIERAAFAAVLAEHNLLEDNNVLAAYANGMPDAD